MVESVNVSLDILTRLVGAATTDPTRYYMVGVHVRSRARTSGVVLEATDGHMLALEHDPDGAVTMSGERAGVIVSSGAIAVIAKAAKAWSGGAERVTLTPTGFTLCAPQAGVFGPIPLSESPFVDGTSFPDVERVIPRIAPGAAPNMGDTFDALRLARLVSTARKLGRPAKYAADTPAARQDCLLWSSGKEGPVLVRVILAPNWLGVIMPVRGGCDQFPSWWSTVDASD
jgi:hypothetical protein